jgi:SAM-dependent methyltransferase
MDRAASHGAKHEEAVLRLFDGLVGPIVDLGCGEGIFAERPGYVGLDREAASAADLRADIRRVPLRDGSCAGALCVNALHAVADPERVLAEIDRVLRSGGRAYLKNRWYKTAGRRRALGSLLDRCAHQASFWLHGLSHGGTSIVTRPNPDGTTAICPGCVRRWFASRGYAVEFPATHVVLLRKPPAQDGARSTVTV